MKDVVNETQVCIKEKVYRVKKNNITLLYDGNIDTFNLGIIHTSSLTLNDLKDLNNLTRRLLKYIKK